MEKLFEIDGIPAFATGQTDWREADLAHVPFAYVIDGKGWKLFKRTPLAQSTIGLDKLPNVTALDEVIRLSAPKLPLELLQRVTAFFKAVYAKQKSEAVGYLLYHAALRKWDFHVPPQVASGGSAKTGEVPRFDSGWVVAGTIHSHGSMSAFHSGTDHADEQHMDGIHITVGKVDSIPEYSCSIVVDGTRAMYSDMSMLIEGMQPSTFPGEWLKQVAEGLPSKWKGDKEAEAILADYLSGAITSVQMEAAFDALDRAGRPKETPSGSKEDERIERSFKFFDRRRFKSGNR